MQTNKAIEYFNQNYHHELENLKKLARIPSISLEGCDPSFVQQSAEATAELFEKAGLENIEILKVKKDTHPYVYADWIHKPNAPTFLLYAHHDVQPIGREDKWRTPPFEPTEIDGRLYGRGTADDKAGIIVHSASIASFLKTCGELPVNVKVLIEGEEEIGSHNLGAFVNMHKEKLKSDGAILTDCANIDSGIPSITTSLRGLVALDIEIEALAHPVHSGLWGGILPDVNLALAKILSSLCDMEGNILVPGLNENMIPLSKEAKEHFAQLKMMTLARRATGLLDSLSFTVPEEEFAERLWCLPHFSINVIESGSRKRVSNIVQDSVWARISIRIVPNMNPVDVVNKLKNHILSVCPKGVKITLTTESASAGWGIHNPEHKVYEIAAKALEKAYDHPTQFIGCGGSIPFVQPLTHELGGIPAILVGVEDPYTNAHGENESLLLSDFKKAILGQIHMLSDLAQV